jgi:hypothetical protein
MLSLLLSAATAFSAQNAFGYSDSTCHAWKCTSDLAQGKNGTERKCAALNTNTNNVQLQTCDQQFFYCPASLTNNGQVFCSKMANDAPVWRQDLAAGDTCYNNGQCSTGLCSGNSTENNGICLGGNLNSTCKVTKDCNPGLYCANVKGANTCQAVTAIGGQCNSTSPPCAFGSACHNSTCTRYGSLDVGEYYNTSGTSASRNLMEGNFYYGLEAFVADKQYLCESFYAVPSDNKTLGDMQCVWGPSADFSDYSRSVSDLDCNYTMTYPNGTAQNMSFPATCGFNSDTDHYCRKTRSKSFWNEVKGDFWQGMFRDHTFNCSTETSFQYCLDVTEDVVLSSSVRSFMAWIWRTTGTNNALVANNPTCVRQSVAQAYYHILEFARPISILASVAAALAFVF